jgi:hypothetical protein
MTRHVITTTAQEPGGTAWRYDPLARRVEACELCGGQRLVEVLNLGSSPPPCVMHPVGQRPVVEERYPLELLLCLDCGLVQLSVQVNPGVMWPVNFPYSSGNSPQLHRDFQDLANEVMDLIDLHPAHLVVDIGANDGTLLSKFPRARTIGVEPTAQARKMEPGLFIEDFFSEKVAEYIVGRLGQARVITACNVLAHVDDLPAVMRGIKRLLAPNGILVVENHDLNSVLAGQWDMVYHEHLRYFTQETFRTLLNQYELGATDSRAIGTHGGSHRIIATHGTHGAPVGPPVDAVRLHGLQDAASAARRALHQTLYRNAPVIGIGAAARATTIINYCGLDVEDIACVVEVPDSDKIGSYIPGTRIPVLGEEFLLKSDRPGLMLSWHLTDIVVPKLRERGFVLPIIVPLPELHYEISARDLTRSRSPDGSDLPDPMKSQM